MSKRRIIIALLTCVALAALITTTSSHSDEPRHKGRSLSQWVMRFRPDQPEKNRSEAGEAIRQIGTNAIPHLIKAIQYEAPPWKREVRKSLSKIARGWVTSPATWMSQPEQRANAAADAFMHLGPVAQSAIPELIVLINDPQRYYAASRASYVLGTIGKPALEPLMNVSATGAVPARCLALQSLGALETNAIPAIPLLIGYLGDANPRIVASAAAALGRIKAEPATVVPALANAIGDSRGWVSRLAANALMSFGAEARTAVPVLVEALSATNASIRSVATNTLRYIAPEVLTNAPPL